MKNYIQAKLNRRLVAMCMLLALMICIATCICGYIIYRDSCYKTYNGFAYEIGEIALSYVNGDKITHYLDPEYYNPETREFTPDAEYRDMESSIYNVYENTTLREYNAGIYIGIPEKTEDGQYLLTNLFDVRIVDAPEESKQYYQVGVVDPIGLEHPEDAMTIFETGERSSDYFIHETSFGYNSSAIIPVKDSSGTVVALLTADMPMPFIEDMMRTFLLNIVFVTVAVVLVFISAFILLIRRTVTDPIKLISEEAGAFTDSDIQLSARLKDITQPDEIGQLADSVLDMERDIQNYVDHLTKANAEKQRISAELDVATEIQKSMLPCIFPAFPEREEVDIYATMDPAKEVGGDFYDFFMVDDTHVAMVAADVSGKGVPAALFMVIGKTLIKDHTVPGRDLGDVFTEVNNLLCDANSQGLFITAFEGVLDLVTGEFCYVNAGHETPFISRQMGNFEPYKVRAGFVLAGMEGIQYKSGSLQLEPGDRVFQYTDGVTEATNSNNELYGMERLENALNRNKELSLDDLLPAVREDIDEFVGEAPQFDDITMVCLEYRKRMEAPDAAAT